jgi:hypothetical protein
MAWTVGFVILDKSKGGGGGVGGHENREITINQLDLILGFTRTNYVKLRKQQIRRGEKDTVFRF